MQSADSPACGGDDPPPGNGHNCITTMANGKLLMRDRRLVDLDEEKINADIMETAKKLWKNING